MEAIKSKGRASALKSNPQLTYLAESHLRKTEVYVRSSALNSYKSTDRCRDGHKLPNA